MKKSVDLPVIKNKKKISKSVFKELARKVRKYLEEEESYVEDKRSRNENRNSSRFSPNY
ncbi:hypothetical protein HY214_02480 [Candidatus Roizmanbacteria bacterium]|nr:hypothetical protein [Candidatus Roizmanbacteria bacterium]